MRYTRQADSGFTIVELLIVIVVIAILAAISIISYNGIRDRAAAAKRNSDAKTLLAAIHAARTNTNKTLMQITNSTWSSGQCTGASYNPSATEPRDLPKTHGCWTRYYADLAAIGTAAGVDLSSLRAGDARGNPYTFDENEGESGNFCATDSSIIYFTGNGVATQTILPIPKHLPPC
jgi:prepilin-type N-terminal cleavage/methylation domain-containing protein